MAFVGFTKENDTRARVNLIHYFPSELDHGILEQGALVDTIPEPDHIPGKGAVLYINPQTKELWYEYVDLPKDENTLARELEETKAKLDMAESTVDTLRQQMTTMQETINFLLGI